MATGGPPKYVIEPLDPKRHDRAGYSCGVEQVDNVFKKTADKLSRADNLRVFVMASEDGAVIGFCALNAHTVSYADLPERSARDRRFSGGGFGGDLLVDCLKRILRASESIGLSV